MDVPRPSPVSASAAACAAPPQAGRRPRFGLGANRFERVLAVALILIVTAFIAMVLLLGLSLMIDPLYGAYRYGYATRDTFGSIMTDVWGDTQWAEGFDEAAFDSVVPGETADAVRKRLGEPLATNILHGEELWFYTSSPGNSHHHQRILTFVDGVVSHRVDSLYWDGRIHAVE
jgi:hypothetical protein